MPPVRSTRTVLGSLLHFLAVTVVTDEQHPTAYFLRFLADPSEGSIHSFGRPYRCRVVAGVTDYINVRQVSDNQGHVITCHGFNNLLGYAVCVHLRLGGVIPA